MNCLGGGERRYSSGIWGEGIVVEDDVARDGHDGLYRLRTEDEMA